MALALAQRLKIGGSPEAPALVLPRGAGLEVGAELDVAVVGGNALVGWRARDGVTGFFAGSLSSLSLGEVVGQVVSGVRSGTLRVVGDGARRTLHFRDGQLVFATSSEAYERLGAVLVQMQLLPGDELLEALAEVKPGAKLGQVLTGTGRLTPAALYSAMTYLTREITLNTFDLNDGQFIFLEGDEPPEDALKLPERTKDIVLAGLKRSEETARLRMKHPPSLRVSRGATEPSDVDASLEPLLSKAAKGAALSELRREFPGSEHGFLSEVARLLARGVLVPESARPEAPRAGPVGAAKGALDVYRELTQALCQALVDAGRDLSALQSFLDEPPEPQMEKAFVGVALTAEAGLDVDAVVANMSHTDEVVGRARAYEALDAFVSYALFSAKNAVAPDTARALTRRFRDLQKGAS